MQFEVMVIVDTDDPPERLLHEIISALEFDHHATVSALVVLFDGEQVALYDGKEQK